MEFPEAFRRLVAESRLAPAATSAGAFTIHERARQPQLLPPPKAIAAAVAARENPLAPPPPGPPPQGSLSPRF